MSGRVVGVRLGWGGPLGFYETDEDELRPGDLVVAEQTGSAQPGSVVVAPGQVLAAEVPPRVVGRARRSTQAEREALTARADTAGTRLLRSLPELQENLE